MKKLTCIVITSFWVHCLLIGAPREQKSSWFAQQINKQRFTVAIVSSDEIGLAIACTLLLKKIPINIILVDNTTQLYTTHSLNMIENLNTKQHTLRQGNLKDAGQADIIILAPAAQQKESQSVHELIKQNKSLLTQCLDQMAPISNKAIICVLTEPVDLMAYYAYKKTGVTYNRIFGIGTYIETAHLRSCISKILQVSANTVNIFTLGQHGENQVIGWSTATIAGIPIQQLCPYIQQINNNIIQKKSNLLPYQEKIDHFTISNAIATILKNILFNKKNILSLSCYNEQHGIYFSQPAVVGENGIERILAPVLNTSEQEKLDYSIKNISELIKL